MYEKNQILKTRITDMTNDGEGVGKIDGYTFFIKDTIIGDEVSFIVTKTKKTYGYGRLKEILERSPHRTKALCERSRSCGGCQIQELEYEKQLEYKKNKVKNNLVRLGGFDEDLIESIMEPVIGMEGDKTDPSGCYRYRNKAQYPIGKDRDGNIVSGFYAGRTHSIINIEDCMISPKEFGVILDQIIGWMKRYEIEPYDEVTHKGIIRHVMLRKGFATGQIMVCLVVNSDHLAKKNELIKILSGLEFEDGSKICHISFCTNTNDTNVIMGDDYTTVYGSDTITDMIGDLRFEISPLSFYQVNPVQTKKLYEKALKYADLTGNETVWDLYCGIGTISLFMAKNAKHVFGVEVIEQAIVDARNNAGQNGLSNTTFYVGRAEEVIDALFRQQDNEGIHHADVVVVDPPRKGCDQLCLETILKMSPSRIVYVSCDSATLSRDLRILCDGGYELRAVTPCDMFPHTVHVETICLLSKGDVKSQKLRVEFSLEDMDTDGFKKGVTYNAIRDWIKEKYGYRVTNLNIAQVKQKHGIIERENYNKPKSPDSKQPGCPEKKVKAIEDAMRHFQMIQ